MKIKEAFWEKRNLGVETLEIEFEETDVSDIVNSFETYDKYGYIVAKVPTNRIDLVHKLESNKFQFFESQISLSKRLTDKFVLPNYISEWTKKIDIELIETSSQLKNIQSEISKGLFDTDRIAIDPYFGKDVASKRYMNWISDEFQKNESSLYELIYQGNRLGFFLTKDINDKTKDLLLGGIYNDYKNIGFGFSIIEKPIALAANQGKKKIITKISSNNVQVLNLYTLLEFTVTDINYVLRKVNQDKL